MQQPISTNTPLVDLQNRTRDLIAQLDTSIKSGTPQGNDNNSIQSFKVTLEKLLADITPKDLREKKEDCLNRIKSISRHLTDNHSWWAQSWHQPATILMSDLKRHLQGLP